MRISVDKPKVCITCCHMRWCPDFETERNNYSCTEDKGAIAYPAQTVCEKWKGFE